MKGDLSPVERLNLVAKMRGSGTMQYGLFGFLLLQLASHFRNLPRPGLTFGLFMAGALGITIGILVFAWRYHLLVATMWFLIFTAYLVSAGNYAISTLNLQRTLDAGFAAVSLCYGCFMVKAAIDYAKMHGREWKRERARMARWIRKLTTGGAPEVAQFDAVGTFAISATWRILNSGSYWVIGRFSLHSTSLGTYSVHERGDVIFTPLPSGRWKIDVRGKKNMTFYDVELSPGLPQTFKPFVQPAMGMR